MVFQAKQRAQLAHQSQKFTKSEPSPGVSLYMVHVRYDCSLQMVLFHYETRLAMLFPLLMYGHTGMANSILPSYMTL